jgi:acetyl esterase/lipase
MRPLWTILLLALAAPFVRGADPEYTRKEDVIYGRKFGVALTLDVFTPKGERNGAGVIYCVSGGWVSAHDRINPGMMAELLKRGYVVFAVVHGSQPRFTIPEVLDDMHRATRFVRAHAKEYGVDPERLGITGGSAGGHLSLMQGVAGRDGDPKARDVVDREPSRVAAVACFFPPTDFLNYGTEGENALGVGTLKDFKAPFDFVEFNPKTRTFDRVSDEAKRAEIGKKISPVYFVTEKSPPTLLIHGDADKLVPIQQSELMIARLKEKNVACELVVKKGALHGWPTLLEDTKLIADWFDKHLGKQEQ